MKSRDSGTERPSPFRWARAYAPAALVAALALGVIFAIVFAATLFTTAISRADGPPDLGTAFTLPFKLEQGRPAPARSSSVPRQVQTPAAPTPAATPGATPGATPEPVAPSTPPSVNAYPVAYSVIEIRWGQPEGEVDGFEVQVSADGAEGSWRRLAGKAYLTYPSGRLYTWTQEFALQRNQTRHYRVRASNGSAWSAWSASVSATTFSTSEPDLWVDAQGKNALKITWQEPSVSGMVTGWTLQVREDAPPPRGNEGWTTLSSTLAAEDRSYIHSGLEPGDTRYYRIRANTGVGTPQWSVGTDHATTLTDVIPDAPVLTVRANGALEILLSWTRPDGRGSPITGYQWQESEDGKAWGRSWRAFAADTGASTIVDWPGTTRYYRVRAKTVNGLGPWSEPVKVTTENGGAGAPTNLEVEDVGATWVDLKWRAPAQVGAGITGYQVQRTNGLSTEFRWENAGRTDAATTKFRDTGLVSVSGYSYRVAARDSGGLGPWADFSISVQTKPLPPAAPRLTARAGTRDGGPAKTGDPFQQFIDLTWTEPTTVYGAPVQFFYHVERSANGTDGWVKSVYVGSGDQYRDYEVEPGKTWYYRVQAKVQHGEEYGPRSSVVSATVRAALPSALPFMSAGAIGEDRIEISWDPPTHDGGSTVTGYEIQVSTKGHGSEANYEAVPIPSASARTYTHRGLEPDTEYCYRYRAKNSVGWSEWSWGSDRECFRTNP